MSSVYVIDDQAISREVLKKIVGTVEDGMQVTGFGDPDEALEQARAQTPDLILTDYKMPQMNGVEFTQRFREIPDCADVPLIVVTGVDDREIRYQALDSGATDFLTKPVDPYECRARCKNLLTLRRQQQIIKDRSRWLEKRVEESIFAIKIREQETLMRLAKAGEYRDEETGNHVLRMSRYSRLISEALGLPADTCRLIELAAPMHDIGKIGIPDSILLKRAKHSDVEFEMMKRHTLIGYDILKDSPSKYLQMGAVIALGHHEKYNGKGYPQGLRGEEIPMPARVVAIADVFDALTSVRPYKAAWSLQDAMEYIKSHRAGHFDPDCVDAFIRQTPKIMETHNALRDIPLTNNPESSRS